MYEEQKRILEEKFVRSELEPSPGKWWLQGWEDTFWSGIISAKDGKCCALSPGLIGFTMEKSLTISGLLINIYGVDHSWLAGSIGGFDGGKFDNSAFSDIDSYKDGYEWGKYMRDTYYLPHVNAMRNA